MGFNITAGIHVTAGSMELAIGESAMEQSNWRSPFRIWLSFNLQSITYRGHFDLMCEKALFHPEGGKWFETWKHSPEERGGYFLGRQWSLQTGSLVKRRSL